MYQLPSKRSEEEKKQPEPLLKEQVRAEIAGEASRLAQSQEVRGQLGAQHDQSAPASPEGSQVQMYLSPAALQAKELRSAGYASQVQQRAQEGVSGGGGPLPYRERIEQAFGGASLEGVQAFTGGGAQQACQTIGAKAYTTGERIAFSGTPDLHTTAHEAAHVMQQRVGVALPQGIGTEGDSYERQADAAANAVAQGRSAAHILTPAGQQAAQTGPVQAENEDQDPLAGLPALSKSQLAAAKYYNESKYPPEGIQQVNAFLKASNPSSNKVDDEFCRRLAGFQQSFEKATGKLTCKTLQAIVDTGLDFNMIRQSQLPKAREKNLLLPLPLFYRIEEALGLPKDGRVTDRFIHKVGVFQRIDTPYVADGWISANGSTVKCLVQKRGLSLEGLGKGQYADYRAMLSDGVFDLTIGAGYDENGLDAGGWTWDGTHIYPGEVKQLESGVLGLGFKAVSQAELQKTVNDAGIKRNIYPGMKYFIKKDHFEYAGRKVHATLTYIPSRQGSGKARAGAFMRGLQESDAAIYFGHGRYQTGPDFDQNFTIQLQNNTGGWDSFPDYSDVNDKFKEQLNPNKRNTPAAKDFRDKYGPFTGSTPLAMLQNLKSAGRFKLITSNDGNLVINPRQNASGEFGLWLISQALNDAQKGAEKELISPKNIKPDRYRLWVFSGCNTVGYVNGIRKYAKATGGEAFTTDNLDLLVTKDETWVVLGAEHALSFLAGMMGMESVAQIQKRFEADKDALDPHKLKEKKGILAGQGFGGNPTL
ncbi:MAG: DUF4157 domain-containing protein [Bradymonadales bacterium]|nr:DUF4157 domain-containing protein [Bradymonadales bacterium]